MDRHTSFKKIQHARRETLVQDSLRLSRRRLLRLTLLSLYAMHVPVP
ncbi:hypothetical protein IC582_011543 [Cucumis melo]